MDASEHRINLAPLPRTDPETGEPIMPPDYRYAVRDAAFRLLAEKQHDALYALHGAFLDRASDAFTARDAARAAGNEDMARYWSSVRRDALNLADQVDAAARMIPYRTPCRANLYCECDACNTLERR
jgi:hypothetical protein